VGQDVVAELTRAIDRQGVDIRVSALVNDTVATLAGSRYENSDVCVAVILDAERSNAAYVERAQAIPKWHGPHPKSDEMVINMEWGNFRSSHLPLTEYDNALDAESLNPGEQIFEKMISGMYLGELLRRVLLRMADEAELFGETVPPKLKTPFIFSTYILSELHRDTSPGLNLVGMVLKHVLQISSTPLSTRKIVFEICNIIATRGARLAAAGILGILKKIGRDAIIEGEIPKTTIAIDGVLFNYYIKYRGCVRNTLDELVGNQLSEHIQLIHGHPGPRIGAAMLAAIHSQYL
ncbi:hexokinase-1-like protein isoform X1, partial [Tanacetum coccineum]